MAASPVASGSAASAPVQQNFPADEPALPERILWIVPPNDDFEHYIAPETIVQKGWRKTKENPLVPVGAGLTVGALCTGLYAMQRGDVHLSQYAMRGRVIFQGFTIGMIVLGMVYGVSRDLEKVAAKNRAAARNTPSSPVSAAMQNAFTPKPLPGHTVPAPNGV